LINTIKTFNNGKLIKTEIVDDVSIKNSDKLDKLEKILIEKNIVTISDLNK